MSGETFYEGLMRRQAETCNYKGKLIIRAGISRLEQFEPAGPAPAELYK
jgi:hypothetical protein